LENASPIRTLRPLAELDYHDARSVSLPVAVTALEAWNIMTTEPGLLLRLAFKTRDAISALFGVKRIAGFSGRQRTSAEVGDRLDFFLVEECAPDRLVLTARDRHLDVMICLSIASQVLTVTASVVTHNRFGRLYMLPVGPAHKLIVNGNLKRVKQALEKRAAPA